MPLGVKRAVANTVGMQRVARVLGIISATILCFAAPGHIPSDHPVTGLAPAPASTSASTVSSTATIANALTIGSGTVNFGAYNPVSTNKSTALKVTGSLTFTVTKGDTVQITLNAGDNSAHATGTTRAMTDGAGNYLSYELYDNSNYTTVWSGATYPSSITSTSGLSATSVPIYGVIPAGQDLPAAASFTDTVIAVITY
jgi:spore coat protein U-like protein